MPNGRDEAYCGTCKYCESAQCRKHGFRIPQAERGFLICADYADAKGNRGIAWLRQNVLKPGFLYNYSPHDLRPGGVPPKEI